MRIVGESRRHPVCPQCGYDLVGTVEAGRARCPECGYEFSLAELRRQGRRGDWTVWAGLRRAAAVLLVKSIVCLPLVAGLFWLLAPGLSCPDWRAIVVLVVAALGFGYLLGHNLTEHAGFVSPVVTLLGALFAWMLVIVGVMVSGLFRPFPGPIGAYTMVVAGVSATAWIIKTTIFDE